MTPRIYYHDSRHGVTLWHGRAEDVVPGLACGPLKLALIDPPYQTTEQGIIYEHTGVAARTLPTTTVGMPWGYSLDWIDAVATLNPAHWLVFGNYLMLGGLRSALARHAQVSSVFVWRKSNAPMARPVPRLDCEFMVWARHRKATCVRMGEFRSLVLDVPMPQAGCMADERLIVPGTGQALHPCQKPLAVVVPFVARLCDPGELVLDCFVGTGTTLVAAVQCGCRAVGVEERESYCEAAARRLEQESPAPELFAD